MADIAPMEKRTTKLLPQLWRRLEQAAARHDFTIEQALEAAVDGWIRAHCPIPGCQHVYRLGGGWDSHVASSRKHANWHPEVEDGSERKLLFQQEYPDWTDRWRQQRGAAKTR